MYTHVGINVTVLEKSIEFYRHLFEHEPVKVKGDYAKFLLEELKLNFTLNLRDEVNGNQVSHFGFQVKNTDEVMAQRHRLNGLGFTTRDEMNVTCCYSLQDKFWVQDPDGNEWEFFVPKEDVVAHNETSIGTCCNS